MSTTIAIGHAIRAARRHHRLTQEQLAELVGTSTRTIRDIEHGSPSPSVGTVIAAAEAVGLIVGVIE